MYFLLHTHPQQGHIGRYLPTFSTPAPTASWPPETTVRHDVAAAATEALPSPSLSGCLECGLSGGPLALALLLALALTVTLHQRPLVRRAVTGVARHIGRATARCSDCALVASPQHLRCGHGAEEAGRVVKGARGQLQGGGVRGAATTRICAHRSLLAGRLAVHGRGAARQARRVQRRAEQAVGHRGRGGGGAHRVGGGAGGCTCGGGCSASGGWCALVCSACRGAGRLCWWRWGVHLLHSTLHGCCLGCGLHECNTARTRCLHTSRHLHLLLPTRCSLAGCARSACQAAAAHVRGCAVHAASTHHLSSKRGKG
mmetsp:Transcript_14954/g.37289  ORF Transcript_14954/g.37289 Transcript_14954/m.37289 type:complete len:314 (+) Transcript_14954:1517-2458(+)